MVSSESNRSGSRENVVELRMLWNYVIASSSVKNISPCSAASPSSLDASTGGPSASTELSSVSTV